MLNIPYFKQRKDLDYNELKDLVNQMNFEELQPNEDVVKYREKGYKFYVIIKGVVSINVPNPAIKDSLALWRYY
jgi:signal-transduction protein with cAMP-binding, CBS, and nucleotidyltransferase domain